MEIVITHRNPDFDALASQIAASKLYPNAVKIIAGGIPPIVRKFLTLHLDHFELMPVKDVDFEVVTRVVVVDVRARSRLKDFRPLFERIAKGDDSPEVIIYDHHGESADDLDGDKVVVEPMGSTVTLLVERLKEENIEINPVEATALALGIYADTGSLTFDTTTERDSRAAAFLVEKGANMVILRYFLHSPLGEVQRQALVRILTNSESLEMNGLRFCVSHVPLKKAVPGLSEVVNEALILSGDEGVFALFETSATISVIGRSWHPRVDVGRILNQLGGGGHQGAGSATLKNTDLEKAKGQLLDVLRSNPPKSISVRDVMTAPVFSLSPREILEAVENEFTIRNISGAPVVKQGKIVGIISKRDVRDAKRDNRCHMAVSSCMSQPVKTTEPDSPLIRVFEKMAAGSVGRLPVLENGELVGIITRNDLVEALYTQYRVNYS